MNTVRSRFSNQPPLPSKGVSLRNRLLVISILLAVLPTLVTGIAAVWVSSQGLTDASFNQLEAVAAVKEDQINSWLDALQTNLILISADATNRDTIISLLPGNAEASITNQVRNEFAANNQVTRYFTEIFILDSSGKIILSTEASQEGKIQSTQLYFREGLKGPYISQPTYEISLGDFSIFVSQPITDFSGQARGVLTGRANLSTLSQIMAERAGLGETGETYIVNANYAALTELRRTEAIYGQTYVRSDGLTAAIVNRANGEGSYSNYVNNDVIGVYLWIPDLQVVLMAEQDEAEALQSVNSVLQISLAVMAIMVLAAIALAFVITNSIARPIMALANVADKISQGDFEQRAVVANQDEIGLLAAAFNTMAARVREFIGTLEQRVAERTQALAISGEISRRLSTILEQDKLVTEVVNQLKEGFSYYHVHIYLLSENGESLWMAGGTGEAGRILLERGHRLPMGRGLVGRAAETKTVVVVPDTRKEPDWLPNPLLPDTRAEIAVPIIMGDQLLGVLDIQNDTPNSLGDQDVDIANSIANQIAIALQNIRQIETTQKIANDLAAVADVGIATATITDINRLLQDVVDLSKKSFNLYHAHIYLLNNAGDTLLLAAGAGDVGRQMVAERHSIPFSSEQSLVARAARTQAGVVVNNVRAAPDFLPNPLLPETRAEMAVPMVAGGNLLGVLDVQSDVFDRFTQIDINIKTTLASQVAVAMQNSQSFAQARQQAERESSINLISQKIQNTSSIEEALQITARELGHALGNKPTLVTLKPMQAVAPEIEAVHRNTDETGVTL